MNARPAIPIERADTGAPPRSAQTVVFTWPMSTSRRVPGNSNDEARFASARPSASTIRASQRASCSISINADTSVRGASTDTTWPCAPSRSASAQSITIPAMSNGT